MTACYLSLEVQESNLGVSPGEQKGMSWITRGSTSGDIMHSADTTRRFLLHHLLPHLNEALVDFVSGNQLHLLREGTKTKSAFATSRPAAMKKSVSGGTLRSHAAVPKFHENLRQMKHRTPDISLLSEGALFRPHPTLGMKTGRMSRSLRVKIRGNW